MSVQEHLSNITSLEDFDNLCDECRMHLISKSSEELSKYKPEIESVEDISVEEDYTRAMFNDVDINQDELDVIVKVDKDSDVFAEAKLQAYYQDKFIFKGGYRDKKVRDDEDRELLKSAVSHISERFLESQYDLDMNDENGSDYDYDLEGPDGTTYDLKINMATSKAFNIPVRRYPGESVEESVSKKSDRDYVIQGYAREYNGSIYIGFDCVFNPVDAVVEFNPEEPDYVGDKWVHHDSMKTWRTLGDDDGGYSVHFFNIRTAHKLLNSDNDITSSFSSVF